MKDKNKIIIISTICILLIFMLFNVYNRARIINQDRFFLTYSSPYNDIVKYIKTKNRGYIKWTSQIEKINSKNQLTLKAPNIPKVVAFFDYSAVKGSFKTGDIITISGIPYIGKIQDNASSYYLKKCRIEKSTKDDLALFNYTISSNSELKNNNYDSSINETSSSSKSSENLPIASGEVNADTPTVSETDSATLDGLQYISEDFIEFDESYDNLTDLQRNNIGKSLRFKSVLWTGYVLDVNKTNITFASDEKSKKSSFIVYMSSDQKEAMLNINKNDKITVSGYILKCKGLTPWVLSDGKIDHP